MDSLKRRLEAFWGSRIGLFVKKVLDDQAPNLAALLAWGTLSTLLPLLLGVLTVAGLVLRDPQRLDDLYQTLLVMVPSQAAGTLGEALQGIRTTAAAPAGVVAVALLLFNGASFFGNMASVFDQVYHVQSRNFLMQRLVSLIMLVLATTLLVVSTLSLGLGSLIGSLPTSLPIGPVAGRVVTWSISILSAFLLFLLLYKVLPNARQGWRQVLPGAVLSSVLFFVILTVFPIYVSLIPPNQAYAVFGVFLVFTFWLYLLGFVFVLGAELNAFLQEPARTVALAEATRNAQQGQATFQQRPGQVEAYARGTAPAAPLGGGNMATSQPAEQPRPDAPRPSLAGRLLGFIGLLIAVFVLRGREKEPTTRYPSKP
jgi:membrane protein